MGVSEPPSSKACCQDVGLVAGQEILGTSSSGLPPSNHRGRPRLGLPSISHVRESRMKRLPSIWAKTGPAIRSTEYLAVPGSLAYAVGILREVAVIRAGSSGTPRGPPVHLPSCPVASMDGSLQTPGLLVYPPSSALVPQPTHTSDL